MAENTEKRSVAPVSEWKDITLVLSNDLPVFPMDGDSPLYRPAFNRVFDTHKGDFVTMTNLQMNSHAGTHMDAPLHFDPPPSRAFSSRTLLR